MNNKKIGIITIIDNNNCGNRLQNYAMQETIKKLGTDAYTIKNEKSLNWNDEFFIGFLRVIKKKINYLIKGNKNFKKFNKNIKFSKKTLTIRTKNISTKYDFFIAGSDQIWKPTRKRLSKIDLLSFAEPHQRISYAASFGIESIEKKYYKTLQEELPKFKSISVREDAGASIIKKATGLDNVKVVLDPTLLMSKEEWKNVEKKPLNLNLNKRYILTYFLGDENSEQLVKETFGSEHSIINFYKYNFGPSEFLYLINNADYILTDSFHGTVFSIIFEKEFFVFNRKQKDTNNNMNSRLDTLLSKLELEDRKIEKISYLKKAENINYKKVKKLIEKEKEKSISFLKKALDIE